MRKFTFLTLCFFVSLCSCSGTNGPLKITADIQGYPDGTMVVLRNLETNKILDTTYIKKYKFDFDVLNTKAAPHGIFIGKGRETEYLALFVENVDITISGKKGEVKYASVKGGEIQSQHNRYFNSRLSLELQLDSLTNVLIGAMQVQDMEKVQAISERQRNLIQEGFVFGAKYIKENSDQIYSAFTLKNLIGGLQKSEVCSLYDNLSPEVKDSEYAKTILKWLELNKDVKIGDVAEGFTLPDIKGGKVCFKDFQGRYILLTSALGHPKNILR